MINVIYLVSQLKPSGPINQALNLMTGFDKTRINAFLVTLFNENEHSSWKSRFIDRGIDVICLGSNRRSLKSAASKLDIIIQDRGIQVVHSSGISADTVNSMLKSHVLKVSTIRSHVGDLGESRSVFVRLYSQFRFKRNLKKMNIRVGCSHALQNSTESDLHLKCECVQNGVDTDHFYPLAYDDKNKLRDTLNLPTDKLFFLSVGVLYKRKQTLELARAFVEADINNAVLVIVGAGEEYDDIISLSNNTNSIIMVGRKEDPRLYYQCADIFVSASLAEGLPNAVLEAMACGLPVLLSDIKPHEEILQECMGAGGFFKCGDYKDMIRALLEIPQWDLREKSDKANDVIRSYFSKYITANNYTKLYEQNIQ